MIITGQESVVINIVSFTFTFFSSFLNARIKLIPKNKVSNVAIKKFVALISEFLIYIKRVKIIAIPIELINMPIKNKTILKLII